MLPFPLSGIYCQKVQMIAGDSANYVLGCKLIPVGRKERIFYSDQDQKKSAWGIGKNNYFYLIVFYILYFQ